MTISEALSWQKTLKARHSELVHLRDQNSSATRRRYAGQPDEIEEPKYDVKALDKRVTLIAREMRILDETIKRANATTALPDYTRDDSVLGELE